MAELLARREEVAAKRAALTDGRWRNREGIGMYQRSTSNALREMLSDLKPAQPTQSHKPRSRTKSRSLSRSPVKRANHAIHRAQAGSSRIQPASIPEESPVPKPSTSTSFSTTISTGSPPEPSPPSPVPRPKSVTKAKAKSKATPKGKAKQKPPQDDSDSDPGMTVIALLKQRRAKLKEVDIQDVSIDIATQGDYLTIAETEDIPVQEAMPSTSMKKSTVNEGPIAKKKEPPMKKTKPSMAELDESVVLFDEGDEGDRTSQPKAKMKGKIQTVVPEQTHASNPKPAKPKKRIEDPNRDSKLAAKSKAKGAGGKKKAQEGEDEESVGETVSRRVSGGKRTERSDDEDEEASPSASKRTKTKAKANPPQRSKPKPRPKSKPKASKAAKSASTSASTSTSSKYRSAPESPDPPEPEDIMVPLQDSPPSRLKSKLNRRRYTLMPVRTEAQMADPEFDPMDCIGWQ